VIALKQLPQRTSDSAAEDFIAEANLAEYDLSGLKLLDSHVMSREDFTEADLQVIGCGIHPRKIPKEVL